MPEQPKNLHQELPSTEYKNLVRFLAAQLPHTPSFTVYDDRAEGHISPIRYRSIVKGIWMGIFYEGAHELPYAQCKDLLFLGHINIDSSYQEVRGGGSMRFHFLEANGKVFRLAYNNDKAGNTTHSYGFLNPEEMDELLFECEELVK